MSIRIGNGTISTNTTNKERIVLNTMTESNMIVLRADASVPSINMVFNDTMILGRRSNTFFFNTNTTSNLLTLSQESNVLYRPTIVSNTFTVTQNTAFSGEVAMSKSLAVSNLTVSGITMNVGDEATYLRIRKGNQNFLTATVDNTIIFNGKLGIGTDNPVESFHVATNALIVGSTQTSNLKTDVIVAASSTAGRTNSIKMNDSVRTSDNRIVPCVKLQDTSLYVNGELVADRFNIENAALTSLTVSCNVQLASIVCSNVAAVKRPTLSILHNSKLNSCNVIDVFIDSSNVGMSLDPLGRLSLGTRNTPRGMIDITHNASNNTSNLFAITGIDPCDAFFVDNNANIGVGTMTPMHHFHINRCDDNKTNSAFIGLYDNTIEDYSCNTGFGPFLAAYNSTQSQVVCLDKHGSLTLGEIDYDPSWTLRVASNVQVPLVQTNVVQAFPGASCNIDFSVSSLSNVKGVYSSDLRVTNFASTSNLDTNYFFASNFSILGLDIFENTNQSYFKLKGNRYIFTGQSACFSPNEADLQTSPTSEGKFKLVTSDLTDSSVSSVGINVIGNSRNSIRVTSSTPVLELFRPTTSTEGYIGLDGTSLFMSYGNVSGSTTSSVIYTNTRQVQISSSGVKLCKGVQVTSDSRVSINLNEGTSINSTYFLDATAPKLLVRGSTHIINLDNSTAVYVNEASGRIGIGTSAALLATCHINGGTYMHGTLDARSNVIVGCNIGIGTSVPSAALHVSTGNALFNNSVTVQGDINYKGITLISSPWRVNGTNTFITSSNVGIGMQSPESSFHVQGRTILASTSNSRVVIDGGIGIGISEPRAAIDIVNSNVLINGAGKLGIGTINPSRGALHVEGIGYFSCNVRIGTTAVTEFALDVGGDINFKGSLYQNSSKYISSQWTTTPTSNLSFASNVGIGTDNPTFKLHVANGNVFVASNLSVGGTLSAARSVSTTSDARVKTNLVKVQNPLSVVRSLNGYKYHRTDTDTEEYGLVAQEVQRVLPELVGQSTDTGMLNISYGNMAAVFVEAIKALQDKIDSLEAQIATFSSLSSVNMWL